MRDLSERIKWRAQKKKIRGDLLVHQNDAEPYENSTPRPIIKYLRSKNAGFAISGFGITIISESEEFFKFSEINEIRFDNSVIANHQYRIFLCGPDRWVQVPQGSDFHGISSIILMCIRMSR